MLTLECIMKRRSIRNFKRDQPVAEEDIKTILKSAMYAPSAMNKQPCEFIVINDKDICKKISEMHHFASYINDSQCGILVCGDTTKDYKNCWMLDASVASQNILLTATDLGLGSFWCGVFQEEELFKNIKKIFNLPEQIVPLNLIIIGYAAKEIAVPNNRFKEEKIHYNKW